MDAEQCKHSVSKMQVTKHTYSSAINYDENRTKEKKILFMLTQWNILYLDTWRQNTSAWKLFLTKPILPCYSKIYSILFCVYAIDLIDVHILVDIFIFYFDLFTCKCPTKQAITKTTTAHDKIIFENARHETYKIDLLRDIRLLVRVCFMSCLMCVYQ